MSATTHTPGPWAVSHENCGGGLNIEVASGLRIAHTAESRDKQGAVIYTQEAKANASLIASAPDLLAAMEAIAATTCDHGPGVPCVRDMARAAIAKAKGGGK